MTALFEESIHHSFNIRGLQKIASSPLYRFSVGLESWFRLPEHGMTQHEILSRGSSIITSVSGCSSNNGSALRIVTTAHVTHPWLYRRFYAGQHYDWLDALYQQAVHVKLTIRQPITGSIVHTIPLAQPQLHPDLDLVVYQLEQPHHESILLEQCGCIPLKFASGEHKHHSLACNH